MMKYLHTAILAVLLIMTGFLLFQSIDLKKEIVNLQVRQNEIKKMELEFDSYLRDIKNDIIRIDDEIDRLNRFKSALNTLENDSGYVAYKKAVSRKIENDINGLTKNKPYNEGHWIVTDIRFMSPLFVMVRYEDGHDILKSLMEISFKNGEIRIDEVSAGR